LNGKGGGQRHSAVDFHFKKRKEGSTERIDPIDGLLLSFFFFSSSPPRFSFVFFGGRERACPFSVVQYVQDSHKGCDS
jgi:hypothetical protein